MCFVLKTLEGLCSKLVQGLHVDKDSSLVPSAVEQDWQASDTSMMSSWPWVFSASSVHMAVFSSLDTHA